MPLDELQRPARRAHRSTRAAILHRPSRELRDPRHARISLAEIADRAPWTGPPPAARVRVPGSKSLTNRALIVAALADGPSTLTGALDSEDTRVMVDSLAALGIGVEHDARRRRRSGSKAAAARSPRREADLYVANSGTSLRFLTALVATGRGRTGSTARPGCGSGPSADLLRP